MSLSNTDIDVIADRFAFQIRFIKLVHTSSMVGLIVAFVTFIWKGVRVSDAIPLGPLAMMIASVAMSYVIPSFVRRSGTTALRGKTEIDAATLFGPYFSGHVLGMGLLFGPGVMSCAVLGGGLGGAPSWFLATPIAILFLMLLRFPRTAAVAEWIKTASEQVGGLIVESTDGSDASDR